MHRFLFVYAVNYSSVYAVKNRYSQKNRKLESAKKIAIGASLLKMNQKYLNLCSEDQQRSYGFGTTLGGVIFFFFQNFHYWVSYPLNLNF